MDAHEPVTLEEGDRYPLGPPYFPSLAQSGSASGLGPEGREFKSLNSDQV